MTPLKNNREERGFTVNMYRNELMVHGGSHHELMLTLIDCKTKLLTIIL